MHTSPSFAKPAITRRTRPVRHAIVAGRTIVSLAAQIGSLWLVSAAASAAAAWMQLPLPGNVLGLVLLFVLLCSGVVKVAWLEPAAKLLVKHLAFFFIPVTVGLLGMGPLFALHGAGILITLVVSAAIGIAVSGTTSRRLMGVRGQLPPIRERI